MSNSNRTAAQIDRREARIAAAWIALAILFAATSIPLFALWAAGTIWIAVPVMSLNLALMAWIWSMIRR